MPKNINLENMAAHLQAMGYKAKAKSFTRQSGEVADIVEISGLGAVNAFYEQHIDPSKSGLKVFGDLGDTYAPAVIDPETGRAVRERVYIDGKPEWKTKRGAPLDAESLKRKNTEIAFKAMDKIKAAVLAAYLIEAEGGDLADFKDAFKLQKYEARGRDADHDGLGDDFDQGAPSASAPRAGTPLQKMTGGFTQ